MKKVFQWKNVTIYGSPVAEVGVVDYVLLLTEQPVVSPPKLTYINFPKKLIKRLPKLKEPKVIHAPIKDFTAPQICAELYARIVKELARYHASRNVSLCVCCAGGMGRTGTVLAALAAKLGVVSGDPVQFIRKVYDKDAIETQTQIEWLERELGVQIKSLPAKNAGVGIAVGKVRSSEPQTQQPPVFGWRRWNGRDNEDDF